MTVERTIKKYGNRTKDGLYQIRYFDYDSLKSTIKFWLIIVLIVFIIVCLIFGWIRVYIFVGSQDSSIFFTLLNAMVWSVYLNSLGIFNKGITKMNYKYYILVFMIFLFLVGFGYFDIIFEINFWFLAYHTFSTSSAHAIWFFWYNIYLWLPIYFISFTLESETSE